MNKITELIKEIEREGRVDDIDFRKTIDQLHEANKKYNEERAKK